MVFICLRRQVENKMNERNVRGERTGAQKEKPVALLVKDISNNFDYTAGRMSILTLFRLGVAVGKNSGANGESAGLRLEFLISESTSCHDPAKKKKTKNEAIGFFYPLLPLFNDEWCRRDRSDGSGRTTVTVAVECQRAEIRASIDLALALALDSALLQFS